jgi:hypothetical protein
MRRFAIPFLLAAVASSTAPAFASDKTEATFTLGISGTVPVVCRAELGTALATVADGRAPLGRLEEYCNDANGYEVYAEASPGLEGASLVIDGVATPLAAGAPTLIVRSATAGTASRAVELRLPDGSVGAGALSLRVVPL